MVIEKLDFGDYAIKDHPTLITIERKASCIELCGNIGKYRERFERELQRMIDAGVKHRFIVVEDYWSSCVKRQRFSKMPPNVLFESVMTLTLKYDIQFIFAGTHEMAQKITRSLLLKAYKYHNEI